MYKYYRVHVHVCARLSIEIFHKQCGSHNLLTFCNCKFYLWRARLRYSCCVRFYLICELVCVISGWMKICFKLGFGTCICVCMLCIVHRPGSVAVSYMQIERYVIRGNSAASSSDRIDNCLALFNLTGILTTFRNCTPR